MAATLDTLSKEALVLPPDQRVALALRLLESVEPEPEPGIDAAWEAEIASRIDQLDRGEIKAVPASEVFDRVRQIAPNR